MTLKDMQAFTLPVVGPVYFVKPTDCLVRHESIHDQQRNNLGDILYTLKYGGQFLIYGYKNHPMEIEADVLGCKRPCDSIVEGELMHLFALVTLLSVIAYFILASKSR